MFEFFTALGEQTQLELVYILTFTFIMLFSVLAYTKRMSVGIALLSMITGVGITWLFAPYMNLALAPFINWVMYGYVLNWITVVSIAHLVSLFAMVGIAGHNLIKSGGKIIWG